MSSSFADLGVSSVLSDALQRAGIDQPFPVQTATLPDALAGRDVCAMAPTGSGKTLAYGITLLERTPKGRAHQPSALVLVPTRELAQQVVSALVPMAPAAKRFVSAFYGGAAMTFQIEQLRRGVDIAVGTPGRLIDLLRREELNLSKCSLVVVDEADRMADMGFMPQISELLDCVSPQRQMLLFSATLDGDVGALVKQYMNDPVRHEVEGQHGGEEEETLAAALRAPHYRVLVKHENKIDVMGELCAASHRSIVFARNRYASERMAAALEERGVSAVYLHGGMSQSKRQQSVRAFTNGQVAALVATDLAARGLHVDSVSLVVHLDPPQDWKDYIHRSGRTARAGARGVVVNLLRRDQLRTGDKMERDLGVTSTAVELEVVVKELESIPAPEAKHVHIHVDHDDTPTEADRRAGGQGRPGRPGFAGPGRGGYGGARSSSGGGRFAGDRADRNDRGDRSGFGGDRAPRGGYGADRGDRTFGGSRGPSFGSARPGGERPFRDSTAPSAGGGGAGERTWRPREDRSEGRPRWSEGRAGGERVATPRADGHGFEGGSRFDGPRVERADRPERGSWEPRADRGPRPDRFDGTPRAPRDGGFDRGPRGPRDSGPRDGGFDRAPRSFDRPADRPFDRAERGPRPFDRDGRPERVSADRGTGRPFDGPPRRFAGERPAGRGWGGDAAPSRGPRPRSEDRFPGARPERGPRPERRHDDGDVGGPRFGADGSPLNRKARRAMQFGAATDTV